MPAASAQEAAPVEAPSKASCAQAYESAQESRAAGQLQETQTRLSVCARPECPSFVQKDCARWLEEVERELPSVVLHADGLDADAAHNVSVTIDGKTIPNAFGGGPIALDPGRHELVAESPGRDRVTRIIVAQQGVQSRPISLPFGAQPAPVPSVEAAIDTGSGGSQLRPYAYVAWGVGAVGLGMFAVLGTLGRADERGLKDDCPSATVDPELVEPGVCLKSRADERKDIYEREFVLADIGLVTGIVGAATGTVLFILAAADGSGSDDAAKANEAGLHLDVSPTPGGGYASVGGVF
ncbi:MAG TPA: hypothetical protein VMG12_25430 [Polyangiaceae bacterium]|nr:hypothetical protein [Polyangiaceae bacterium]